MSRRERCCRAPQLDLLRSNLPVIAPRVRTWREPINLERPADVGFGTDNGLNPEIATRIANVSQSDWIAPKRWDLRRLQPGTWVKPRRGDAIQFHFNE
jgi:hypothetical protein